MIKEESQTTKAKNEFFINSSGAISSHLEKCNIRFTPHITHKNNSKWNRNQAVKMKTIKYSKQI